jgi:hypothetical protein
MINRRSQTSRAVLGRLMRGAWSAIFPMGRKRDEAPGHLCQGFLWPNAADGSCAPEPSEFSVRSSLAIEGAARPALAERANFQPDFFAALALKRRQ